MSFSFPISLFILYFVFYSGQAIYNTYINLYLSEIGLNYSQIGLIISISTVFLLISQMFFASISDKSRNKAYVLSFLLFLSSLSCLLFYCGASFFAMLFAVAFFSLFYNPIIPLLDNYSVECVEIDNRYDYGHIRMGGTIGYCLTVLLIGFFIKSTYRPIFAIICACFFIAFLCSFSLKKIRGFDLNSTKEAKKVAYKKLLGDRTLGLLISFNLVFSMGLSFFYSFYPIYFTQIGGDSAEVGVMMFLCAITEIPMLAVIGKLEKKFGTRSILIVSGFLTSVRWLLLFLIENPIAALFVNLLHGPCYISFSYSIITYIGKNVPKELRATGQSLNALISTLGSKVIFGYVGGLASAFFGLKGVMLASSLFTLIGTFLFFTWSKNSGKI